MSQIKVLIIDDSAAVRAALSDVLEKDPTITVMAAASDPFAAAQHIARELPDVITLGIDLPRMDGVTFLRKVMEQHPIPTVICLPRSEEGSDKLMQALESGAVDTIFIPQEGRANSLHDIGDAIRGIVRAAARGRLHHHIVRARQADPSHQAARKSATDVVLSPQNAKSVTRHKIEKVVCIGASTGGTESLRQVLEALPADCPGIVIVQHMPELFTAAFARRLNSLCTVSVKEAEDGDLVQRGQVLIAPGNRHMLLKRRSGGYHVCVTDGPPVSRHRPSVDVLFRSAAQFAGPDAVGIIMTGMGDDGARGLLDMKNAGALTIAQNQESCVVFGMPREAIARGAANKVVPLHKLADEIRRADAA